MSHKRITGRIPKLLPLAICRPRRTIEVFINCGAYGAEGRAGSDTRGAYLGTLLGYAEQMFTRCILGTGSRSVLGDGREGGHTIVPTGKVAALSPCQPLR